MRQSVASLWTKISSKRSSPFFVIAGTNVVEDRKSLLRVAKEVVRVTTTLGLPVVFKASFDKANRTSLNSFRGPGMKVGLECLRSIKDELEVPILTDVHEISQVNSVLEVADVIQIPSFLCRQTDLLVAAAQSGKIVNIKKGQFASPQIMEKAVEKVQRSGNDKVMVCERGSSWGMQDLVFDPRQLVWMRKCKVPVIMDCTHVCQQPASFATPNMSTGFGDMVPVMARAAVAIGIDGLFIECHEDPSSAPVDGSIQLPLPLLQPLLEELLEIAKVVKYYDHK
mmetsp:Transcript_7477/g.9494  ORF Transcript_7477/g.9494 Transcript_7477/m.9494 type:complete len:282 (-) Transcript_7477:192-1037(-)|eukprot:CAMPEP_0204846640 /NCGR_PEP_ID=MMETSP1347-20130617/2146_1 /ASSEMBLY_ACC=CAM_ASM_000690 /TAXON_ID=215587 /ORGANISM="Aplanochytrium stocchinoi, Strain GSBS06" /LENGTH=281 /DNA_ID=CAMNT_0051987295 /DNA_START=200 /DNA_END=1045 /DNA_ORIENTATION=-